MKTLVAIALLLGVAAFASKPKRIPIAVLDTGIRMSPELEGKLCTDSGIDLTGKGIVDINGHGTNVASIIARQIDGSRYCVLPIKWYHTQTQQVRISSAVYRAIAEHVGYINISAGGPISLPPEKKVLRLALEAGIVIAVAAGNDGKNLSEVCYYYPACYPDLRRYPGYYVVANVHDDRYLDDSNYGGPVNAFGDGHRIEAGGTVMSGTSQATANFLGDLIANEGADK